MKQNIKQLPALLIIILAVIAFSTKPANSHCEIPCGIYEDTVRIHLLKEHITTIEKSMNQIIELSGAATPNYNQIVRWVTNKEEHADKIQDIVMQYFMTQRIKPVDSKDAGYGKYQSQLGMLHNMLVLAMKCKQTTDLEMTKKLLETVEAFEKIYFHKH